MDKKKEISGCEEENILADLQPNLILDSLLATLNYKSTLELPNHI